MPSIADWDREIRSLNREKLNQYQAAINTLRDWELFAESFDASSLATVAILFEHRVEQLQRDDELERFLSESGDDHGIDGKEAGRSG